MVMLAGCGSDDESSDEDPSSESVELPAEAAEALVQYREATAELHDGDAMLGYVTDDFTFLSVGSVLDADGYAAEVDGYASDFAVESLGGQSVVGAGGT
ncbi:MAG: hypothetical protein OES57_15245, partial [Acidimicrobiia bacterium]|nr:hypothetical protein [Acidimicrobiia bacterium]